MYFAVNPTKTGLPERILATLSQLREQLPGAPIYCYPLVDASFDQTLPVSFPWRRTIKASLYDSMRLKGLKGVAPHLLDLPDEPEKQLPRLQQLVETCTGKPMLSMLLSAIPANELRAHFEPYLLARTKDSMEWPVRWADTRVLPSLIAALTHEERRHLRSPLHVWMSIDRQGEVMEWQGDGNPQPEPADFDCWPLDEARFGKLLDDAEADAVLSELDDTQSDLFAGRSPAETHACAHRHLIIASQHNIAGAGARRHFTMLALSLRGDFIADPFMQAALNRIQQGADYPAEIDALPPTFWEQHSRKT